MNALEVGRLDMVRAFATDAPPAKLAFYTPAAGGASPNTHQTLPRLSDLLRLGDAGLKALLTDWLDGVLHRRRASTTRWPRATSCTHGEVIMTREGHAVSAARVSFYAPDSEQAGLLARAQEIENLERQLRAQALIADEARSRRWCAPRPPTPTPSQRLVARAPRSGRDADAARTSCRSRCCA